MKTTQQQFKLIQNADNAFVVVRRLRRSILMPGCKTL
jgi:hypothetical protein